MKTRFNTIDIAVAVRELNKFCGMRVLNVYDVDNKTYLIRLGKPDDKITILIESGIRIHSTEFDWPKNNAPSGFSMKMRKHIKGRRLESVLQLGVDRIVDLQFGSSEAAYHVILELYDRGNIVLTDYEYTILNILRPRTDTCQDVRFAVRETYPISQAKQHEIPTDERMREILLAAKNGDPLKKVLIPHLDYGPALIEHCLMEAGFPDNVKIGKGFSITDDMEKLRYAMQEAERLFEVLRVTSCQGYITQKKEKRASVKDGESDELLTYEEFHPMLFRHIEQKPFCHFETFNKAVDEFFSKMESQKLDVKTLQMEKSALKKLENVKKDHEKRIETLQKEQETDIQKGHLIEMNLNVVDHAILIVNSAIANQIDWTEIWNLIKEAQSTGDPVASAIKSIKLDTNQMTMLLKDPYVDSDEENEDTIPPMKVDIDLSLSAYANSRKFFEKKKQAAKKEQKTIDASTKALKSAEKKTKETLKEVATAASINKARKTHWFEKFLWFITSENFLVVGGRDQQQNELIVKRYLKPGDVYVHADLHGATSVVIKNHNPGEPVPPKTLNEAGTMAICNSAAWDAKVVTSAWWVHHDQVSKTAPSGEYLTTGSFMIRGKKNYLPPSYLIYGFGILFKLEEGSIFRHKGERKIRTAEEDEMSVTDSIATESEISMETNSIGEDSDSDSGDSSDNDDDSGENDNNKLPDLKEEMEEDFEQDYEVKVESSEIHKKEDNDDDENKEVSFPDTSISLQHVKGDKYELQRGRSSTSESIETSESQIQTQQEMKSETKSRMSAKQRREMRKARKNIQQKNEEDDDEDKVSWLNQEQMTSDRLGNQTDQGVDKEEAKTDTINYSDTEESKDADRETDKNFTQQQPKRGQKGKRKKIKEKYADQDEEERQLRMDILASAGEKKEDKRKKGKKGKETEKIRPQSAKQQIQKAKGRPKGVDVIIQPTANLIIEDSSGTNQAQTNTEISSDKMVTTSQKPEADDDVQEEDNTQQTDDIQILDSLTGQPVIEDELLFAIPVVAPYNALNNYKYKVKLLPGSTKRGKGAKTAMNMFQHERSASTREKDLLRHLKDADISRNIPGKIKVSAPNLHKKKGK